MLIRKVVEDKEHPFCPDCAVPLYLESKEYSDVQLRRIEREMKCAHEYGGIRGHGIISACELCGYDPSTADIPSAKLMRCPKCGALFHVEG